MNTATLRGAVISAPLPFPLYQRSQFREKVFWPALKRKEAMVVGFNLGYDLTRIALDWKEQNKGEWSLKSGIVLTRFGVDVFAGRFEVVVQTVSVMRGH
jgi:hypothetical protein